MKTTLQGLVQYFNEVLEERANWQAVSVHVDRAKLRDFVDEVSVQLVVPQPKLENEKNRLRELLQHFSKALEQPGSSQAVSITVERVKLCDFVIEVSIRLAGPQPIRG